MIVAKLYYERTMRIVGIEGGPESFVEAPIEKTGRKFVTEETVQPVYVITEVK